MTKPALVEVTFRLPADIYERVQDSAVNGHLAPDQVIADALRGALPPTRASVSRRVQSAIRRLSGMSDADLEIIRDRTLPECDDARLSELLRINRARALQEDEAAELNALQTKVVNLSAERVLASILLRDRGASQRRQT